MATCHDYGAGGRFSGDCSANRLCAVASPYTHGADGKAIVLSVLSTNYEMCLEYSCVADLRAAIGLPEAAMNRIALAVGLDRIAAAPLAYARLIWRNYRAIWVPYTESHPDLATDFTAFIASHQPLPFAARVPSLTDTQVNPQSLFVRPTMIAIIRAFNQTLTIV